MKLVLTFSLLLFYTLLSAQNLTGIWRGYFISGNGLYEQRYNYEVQILQTKSKNSNAAFSVLKGVTYSFLSKAFYGKAALHGIFNVSGKSITFAEDTLLEVKNSSGFTCLMTCYLEYLKKDTTQILQGNFSSMGIDKKEDCGPGYVYLERVHESEFKKEDFLVKKSPSAASPKSSTSKSKQQSTKTQSAAKPSAPVVRRSMPSGKNFDTTATIQTQRNIASPPTAAPTQKPLPPTPAVLKERENNLVKSIETNSPKIKIELYDNGIIDGDTITVYHNNQLIVDSKELTEKPITINITADSINTHHEFIMVANNLGRIPPNTALLVVTTGDKRYEINISSDEKTNAKLVVDYKP